MCIASMPRSPGTHLADDRVEVGAVAIDESAGSMDGVADRLHVGLEQAAGVGIGDHHRRDVGAEAGLQRLQVDAAGGVGRDVLDAIAGEGRRRRVGAMGAFRHQHHLALVAARFERGANAQQAAQLAMGAGLRAHRDARHAGELEQPDRQLVDDLKRALDRLLRLQRMDVGKAGQPRDLLVQARVVLHRARPEREQAEVDRVILPRQASVMAHRLGFAQARQADRPRALEAAEAVRACAGHAVEIDAGLVGARQSRRSAALRASARDCR